jgi:tetratricopeptide (TPR) repeat protein
MHNKIFLSAVLTILLSGCDNNKPPAVPVPPIKRSAMDFLQQGPVSFPPFFSLGKVQTLVKRGRLKEASVYVNQSINIEPRNTALHLLNAFIYESLLQSGRDEHREMIDIAYRTAMDLDRTLWLTHHLRGLTAIKMGNYQKAKEYFADALILRPNDPEIMYALSYAAYYSYDLPVALAFIEKAVPLCPNQPHVVRAAAIITAAIGSAKKANDYFERYKKMVGENEPDLKVLKMRLQEWNQTHTQVKLMSDDASGVSKNSSNSDYSSFEAKKSQTDAAEKTSSETIVFDTTLLNAIEQKNESKGQNIFNSLQVVLGDGGPGGSSGSIKPEFSVTKLWGNLSSESNIKGSATILAYAITPFALQYSLNIANASSNSLEILSRTTLSTTLGNAAYFLQGSQYTGATSGNMTGATTSAVDAGIRVEITPLSLSENGEVVLEITLVGSNYINAPNPQEGISNQVIQTQRTKVSTTVKAFLGQTIMIAGIQTLQQSKSKSGFPLLQNIPILQYFTSTASSTNTTASAIFLATPRLGSTSGAFRKNPRGRSIANELRSRGLMAIGEFPNTYYILKTLEYSGMFAQFKSGDLSSPTWNYDKKNLDKKIKDLISFLWY